MESGEAPSFAEQLSMKDDKQLAGSHQEPVKTFEGHERRIICIATFPDGKRIATGSRDETLWIWRIEDGTEKKWVVKNGVGALVVLRNGTYVVSAEGEEANANLVDDMRKPSVPQYDIVDTSGAFGLEL
ncbi:hypothetical protein DFH29DRAFT_1078225 [Suillus ampliporus]|nr:hypothetical protein DFH29DRAFT_1078225 [Suillus ampliporus]